MSTKEFTEENIKKLGMLSRVNIDSAESGDIAEKLNSIMNYVNTLQSIDTDDVEPLSHVHGSTNVTRADEQKDFDAKEAILKNTPDSSGRFIKVPLIISQDEEQSA